MILAPVSPPSEPPPAVAEEQIPAPAVADRTPIDLDTVVRAKQTQKLREMASAQEHYSLRWNDHQNQILLAFDALLQTKSLVDVTLVCADTSIRAHKVVLSACSPFFQRVFAENPCKHPVIVLKDFGGWVVQAIVDFMYRGEISVPQERLQTLIQAGESLQVRGLIDHPVTGNTPTPAASPDEFNGLISGRHGDTSAFLNHKLMFTPQIFMDSHNHHHHNHNNNSSSNQKNSVLDSLCTSPMPRRKQARPRRRSGDFSPQNGERSANEEEDQDMDTENNKNYKNLDGADRDEKSGSISKSSSVLSLDTATEEPEDLCTKPLDGGAESDAVTMVSGGKRKRLSGGQSVQDNNDNNNCDSLDETSAKKTFSEDSANAKVRTSSDKSAVGSEGGRIMLSLKDIRQLNNENSQRTQQLMASRFLNQSPNTLLKTMSSHLAFAEGRLSPKSLAALQFRRPAMDLTCGARGEEQKYFGNHHHHHQIHNNHKQAEDHDGGVDHGDEDEDEDGQQDKSMGEDLLMDGGDSGDEQQQPRQGSDCDGRKSSQGGKEGKQHRIGRRDRHPHGTEDNNNNSRLDMLMSSMNGPNALLLDHMDFKHRQHLFQQQQEAIKSGQMHLLQQQHQQMSHRNSSGDLLGDSRKNHNESTPVGGGGNNHHQQQHHRGKDFSSTSPMGLTPFNMSQAAAAAAAAAAAGGDAHPQFPGMPSVSSLALTPPHMFGLDTPLGLFPPHGMDHSKLYSPLMEMSDPRGMHPEQQPFLKKKGKFLGRPKGQHSAPRGGPPRSWTNAELTEALQHVWNKKMTTSQASRIFGIPYNSLLMYVRGKYGKSLKLEQLRKDCISGPPIELLQMGGKGSNGATNAGSGGNSGNNKDQNNAKDHMNDMPMSGGTADIHGDLLGGGNGGGGGGAGGAGGAPGSNMFNPFPANFYPDFAAGFPGLPLSMLNLLPPDGRQAASLAAAAAAAGHLPHNLSLDDDDDCKSEGRSKQSMDDEDFAGTGGNGTQQAMDRHEALHRQEILLQNQD